METMVSIMDQDKNVCLRDRLKNSLNIQKPVSLTWENIRLPAPTANTINSGDVPVMDNRGNTIPAAVSPATVAEPRVTLNKAATAQPAIKGESS